MAGRGRDRRPLVLVPPVLLRQPEDAQGQEAHRQDGRQVGTQSTNREATAAFWRTFRHDGKISPGWLGWGVHVHPLSLHLTFAITYKVAVHTYTFQLHGQIHSPFFISTNIQYMYVLCECDPEHRVENYKRDLIREYRMIYRGSGFLAVV